MVPYIIAGVVAIALLYGAYRTLGGSASQPVDSNLLLRAVAKAAEQGLHEVDTLLNRESTLAGRSAVQVASTAAAARRRVDGCSQQLQQVGTAELDDAAAAVHALLSVGLDELSWCVRLLQAPAYAAATGLQDAVAALRDHAGRCIAEASEALGGSARAEEVERAL